MHTQDEKIRGLTDRWSYLWLAIGAFLGLFAFGSWIIPLAAWLTTVFSLRFLRTQPPWRGFTILVVMLIGVTAYAGIDMVPMPFPMSIGLIAVQVFLASLPFLADRLIVPRLHGFVSTLVFPLAATAWEFINLTNSPLGSFGSAAYVNYGNLPLMQLAALTGIWGITFLMHWFATTVNWAWEREFAPARVWRGAALYGGVFALVLAYGNARLLMAPAAPQESVRMAGITHMPMPLTELLPLFTADLAAFRAQTQAIHAEYLAATVREAQAGAQLVNWPEGAGGGIAEDVDVLIQRGRAVAQAQGIYLAMPTFKLYSGEERPAENRLLVFDPAGEIVLDHVKYGGNFLEGTLLGDGVIRTFETPFGRLSGVICWDADFVRNMRQAALAGVDLMVIGANDWAGVSEVHAQMAVFRAIENGFAVLRQTSNGISLAADPYGRVSVMADHFRTPEPVLITQVPAHAHVNTLYTRIGDAFGWVTVIGFATILLWVVIGRRFGRTAEREIGHSEPATV